jgi:hypothetical protein
MIANTNDHVREVVRLTGLMTTAVLQPKVSFRIDATDALQVRTQIVADEGPKPAQGMTSEALLKRVTEWFKAGFRVTASADRLLHSAVPSHALRQHTLRNGRLRPEKIQRCPTR